MNANFYLHRCINVLKRKKMLIFLANLNLRIRYKKFWNYKNIVLVNIKHFKEILGMFVVMCNIVETNRFLGCVCFNFFMIFFYFFVTTHHITQTLKQYFKEQKITKQSSTIATIYNIIKTNKQTLIYVFMSVSLFY